MRHGHRFSVIAALVACAALCLVPARIAAQPDAVAQIEAQAAKDGTITRYKGWEVRYGVAGGASADLSGLKSKAESFALDVLKFKDEASGESRVFGTGEAQGLFAVPLAQAVAVVLDYPNLKAISPRVREVKVLESLADRFYVYEDIGINFMGISIGYKLDAETYRDDLGNGAVGVRSKLMKSHDNKLYASDSSWYFKTVTLDGVDYTYIRTWSTSGLRNPGAGVAGIMKLFTSGELRDQVNAVAKVAGAR